MTCSYRTDHHNGTQNTFYVRFGNTSPAERYKKKMSSRTHSVRYYVLAVRENAENFKENIARIL